MSLAGRTHRSSVFPGDVVNGRYTVIREIGSGTFGTVFFARHVLLGHSVALKVLNQRFVVDEATRARFNREVQAAATIDHPGIVDVFDADITDSGVPFVAMEWLDGETLRARQQRKPLMPMELFAVFRMLLEALTAAHDKAFVHRDLKPENIFLQSRTDGRLDVKILDFGLARHEGDETVTESGISLGTPQYMSPEQIMNAKDAGPSADVWAIGVMLYEALARKLPFYTENSKHALMLEIMTKDHAPLSTLAKGVAPGVIAVVERCLVKEPKERFRDARALNDAFLRAVPSMPRSLQHDEPTLRDVRSSAEDAEPTGSASVPSNEGGLPASPYAQTEPSGSVPVTKARPPVASDDPKIPTTRAVNAEEIRIALAEHPLAKQPAFTRASQPKGSTPNPMRREDSREEKRRAPPSKKRGGRTMLIVLGLFLLLLATLAAGAGGYGLYNWFFGGRIELGNVSGGSIADPTLVPSGETGDEGAGVPQGDFLDRDEYPFSTPSAMPPREPNAPANVDDLEELDQALEEAAPSAQP